jgi:predicted component of type VI protein secretion system
MMKKMIALVGAFALAVVFVGCASSQKPCSCKGCVPGAACACGCGQNPCACGHGCACTK